jgi:threonyl-tRNA synthetase
VVGAREAEEGTVSVRRRAGEDLGALSTTDFLARVRDLVSSRSREL